MASPLRSQAPGSWACGHTVGLVPLPSATVHPVDVSEGAGTGSVPWPLLLHQWDTEVFPLSLFFLSVRASSQCSMKSFLPVPFVPAHLPPRSSLPPMSRIPWRFSQLQDSVLLTFYLLSLTMVLKHHSLSSFDGVCFLGKHFTFSVTELNIPFNCISCFILSHLLTFQYVIEAVASPNAVMVKHIQFSESAFVSSSSNGCNVPILLGTPCQNVSYLSFLSCRKKTNLSPASSCSPAHFKLLHPPSGFVIPLPEPLPSFWSCADVKAALLNLDYLPATQLSCCTSCAESCDDQPVPLLIGKGNTPFSGAVPMQAS